MITGKSYKIQPKAASYFQIGSYREQIIFENDSLDAQKRSDKENILCLQEDGQKA